MTKARLDGLHLLVLGSIFFVSVGVLMELTNPLRMSDFGEIYWGSRCVAKQHDPYRIDEMMAVYRADTGSLPSDSGIVSRKLRKILFLSDNLPTTLFLVAPLAALPWKLAVPVWMLLITACFILACVRIWSVGAEFSPRISGGLLFLLLVNSGLLLSTGNVAGLVVSLSAIAVCCFLDDQYGLIGILCLAIALLMKPHDAGPIWLYFLLAGGTQRKRALQTLVPTAAIILLTILWISHAAPHWLPELQSNVDQELASGGLSNPGPTTQGARGVGQMINLQAALGLIWRSARLYNLVSYILCGALLVLWCVKTLRGGCSPRLAWLALAGISALTMLPLYHRTYDARLLVLAIPACAMLWSERAALGRWALALTIAAIVLTGDLFWISLFQITHYSGASVAMGMIPAPTILLGFAVFYVWIYLRSPSKADQLRAKLMPQLKADG